MSCWLYEAIEQEDSPLVDLFQSDLFSLGLVLLQMALNRPIQAGSF